jgi:ATP-dependent DNA helicase RecG
MSLFVNEEPEREDIEFKTASGGRAPQDLWEVVTGFSNAEGGRIVFGVKPDGSFAGLTADELDLLQQTVNSQCTGDYNHRLYPEMSLSKGILSVYIPPVPAALRPIYSKSRGCPVGAKVRVGSSNVQIDDEWMRRFAIAARGGAELLEYDYDDGMLDQSLLDDYIARVNKARGNIYVGMETKEILTKLRVLTKSDKITLFGVLAFARGAAVQEIISPTTNIAITHYRGSSKVVDPGESDPFETNKEFFGSVTKQFDGSFKYLLSSLPIKGTIDESGKRKDYFIIPDNAIREVLANAIAHRDYSVQSSRIQIDIYSDRIEFINPGRSLVPIKDLDTTPSISRNPTLMSFLKDMGYTEQRARGIKTIKDAVHDAGLQEPSFVNQNESFIATLYSSAFMSNNDQKWLNQFSQYKLNERQLNALAHVRNTPQGINNTEYRDVNSMNKVADDKRANRELKALVEHGLLIKAGKNISTRYYLSTRLS